MTALARHCEICPRPGSCCKGIRLFGAGSEVTFWVADGDGIVRRTLDLQKVPFTFTTRRVFKDEKGREYRTLAYECPKLLPNGRCGDYANRPGLCRVFQAGEDSSCLFSKRPVIPENGEEVPVFRPSTIHPDDLELTATQKADLEKVVAELGEAVHSNGALPQERLGDATCAR